MDDLLLKAVLVAIVVVLVLQLVQMVSAGGGKKGTGGLESHDDISVGLRRESLFKSVANLISSSKPGSVLSSTDWTPFELVSSTMVSHNTVLLRFEVPDGKALSLPIGRHLSIRAEIDGNFVQRPYTPTSDPDQTGYFELLVKVYDLGKMSSHLHRMRCGDCVDVRGPVGRFKYMANQYKCIGLVAGGTGLTPCLQVVRSVLEGNRSAYKEDTTKFILYYQNRKEEDVLLRSDLDSLVEKHGERFTVTYFLSNPSTKEWGQSKKRSNEKRGYIAKADMQKLAPPGCGLVCVCGPSGFNRAMRDLMVDVGHTKESIYTW
jgi:cytochrome-b5 reductase